MEQYFPEGATPLSPDDMEGIIPEVVVTRSQLDQFESGNI